VLTNSVTLVKAMQTGAGTFREQLLSAGNGSSLFTTEQSAVNSVAQALFYLDGEVKDVKLAIPLGLNVACPSTSCPDRFESRYARVSTSNLRANLRGFRKLFQGCGPSNAGIGVDDWLTAVGKPDLAARMLSALSDAETAIDNLGDAIEPTLLAHPERVRALYDAIKRITDPLKTELVTALNIELPRGTESDND
jgi:hypothetical protein